MKSITEALAYGILVSTFVLSCTKAQVRVDVIPYPNQVEVTSAKTDISKVDRIVYDEALGGEADFLQEALEELGYGEMELARNGKGGAHSISLKLDESRGGEGYVMKSGRRSVEIRGSQAGVFYGIQTLLQQIVNDDVRCGEIVDAPRYEWRGFMLDEARHFFGKEKVESLLDMMAYFKLNKFHWHLTDAQGWRIEIKGYPKLTEIGGIGTHSDPDAPAQFYTQEEIREIVAYAAERI